MALIATIIMVIIAIAIFALLFFIFKNWLKLVINAICGVVILLIASFTNLFPNLGSLDFWQVLICAVGGIPGAIILIILSFFGITI